MKRFFEKYLDVIKEDTSSRYIEKSFFMTIGHNDIFITPTFFNAFPKDYTEVNIFLNKFIEMTKTDSIKSDREYLVYDTKKSLAVILKVFVKGTFRHDIILMQSFNCKKYPSIRKSGQIRIIF